MEFKIKRGIGMDYVSTEDAPGLTPYRANGNTTRQANFAIEALFNGHIVKLRDHGNYLGKRDLDERLRKIVVRRLEHEMRFPMEKVKVFFVNSQIRPVGETNGIFIQLKD